MNTSDPLRRQQYLQLDLAIPLGTSAFIEVNKLAAFLLDNYPDYIEAGESAVDVAIRMMKLMQQVLNTP